MQGFEVLGLFNIVMQWMMIYVYNIWLFCCFFVVFFLPCQENNTSVSVSAKLLLFSVRMCMLSAMEANELVINMQKAGT